MLKNICQVFGPCLEPPLAKHLRNGFYGIRIKYTHNSHKVLPDGPNPFTFQENVLQLILFLFTQRASGWVNYKIKSCQLFINRSTNQKDLQYIMRRHTHAQSKFFSKLVNP
ncbi:unnamed protein product [Cuscuta epithymum]|uniref:Uncharacterized protein n=1 Tax=Cuscuta epithymum TaxID=186058 RepID=A0AAV0DKK2_9ASTE|nr:unnamed protein product [Cuscuta epithymum]CAH9140757.1 unnamed protein product [Cuscuta epithymum]